MFLNSQYAQRHAYEFAKMKMAAEKKMAKQTGTAKKERKAPKGPSSISSNRSKDSKTKLKVPEKPPKLLPADQSSHTNDSSSVVSGLSRDESLRSLNAQNSIRDLNSSRSNELQSSEKSLNNKSKRPVRGFMHQPSQRSIRSFQAGNNDVSSSDMILVDQIWEKVKKVENYSELLGEQIVLKLMELEPKARTMLGIKSLRDKDFLKICTQITDMIDLLISFLGPHLEDLEDELKHMKEWANGNGLAPELRVHFPHAFKDAIALILIQDGQPPAHKVLEAVKSSTSLLMQKLS